MKKLFALAVFIGLSPFVIAQKKIIFHYINHININGITSDIKLEQYYLNGRSLEMAMPSTSFKNDTTYDGLRARTRTKLMMKGDEKRIPFVLKSPDISGLIYAENIWPKATYLVVDTLNNFNWEISPETRNINGETCTRAKTKFRGREYISWFKKDNLIKAGP